MLQGNLRARVYKAAAATIGALELFKSACFLQFLCYK